jgi:hypothetical protein
MPSATSSRRQEMERLFRDAGPRRSLETRASSKRIDFDLDELAYEYPDEPVPPGWSDQAWLWNWSAALQRHPLSRRGPGRRSRPCCARSSLIAAARTTPAISSPSTRSSNSPSAGHPLPGPRLGGQFRRLLCASASPPSIPADQLLFERFISTERKRAARYRHRFRA